jgi:LysM repeat protein
MAGTQLDGLDDPACPFLGLVADRRSHFTYPHPGHRCFAKDRPVPTDAGRQARYCLSGDYTDCDRYPARQVLPRAGAGPKPRADVPGSVVPVFRVHVVRAGGSLAGIAVDLGLTPDQIARANGLNLNDVVAEGARLVIPLTPPAASLGRTPDQRRADRSG